MRSERNKWLKIDSPSKAMFVNKGKDIVFDLSDTNNIIFYVSENEKDGCLNGAIVGLFIDFVIPKELRMINLHLFSIIINKTNRKKRQRIVTDMPIFCSKEET